MTDMFLISAHILDPFWQLRSSSKWDKRMDINPKDDAFYLTQYQDVFQKYFAYEYSPKHPRLSVTKPAKVSGSNLFPSAKVSGFGRLSFHPYDLSSNNEGYLPPKTMAETLPGRSDCAATYFTARRLYLNSLSEALKNWGQVNPNCKDYHSDPMEIHCRY